MRGFPPALEHGILAITGITILLRDVKIIVIGVMQHSPAGGWTIALVISLGRWHQR
jgi:hypothetical protein